MQSFDLIYYAAAAWYLAYVLTKSSGPFGIIEKLREWRDGSWHGRIRTETDSISGLFDCIICTMFWAAVVFRLVGHNVVTDAFAIAGAALWIHSFTGWRLNV